MPWTRDVHGTPVVGRAFGIFVGSLVGLSQGTAVVRVKSKTVCQVVFCRRHTIPVEFRIGCSDTELKLGFAKF